ncbi:MAG TPA: hypothetical protein VF433_00260, partial [Cellvibrio sp.]
KRLESGAVVDTITTRINVDAQSDDEERPFYFLGTQTFTRDLPADSYLPVSVNLVDGLGKTWNDVNGMIYITTEPD